MIDAEDTAIAEAHRLAGSSNFSMHSGNRFDERCFPVGVYVPTEEWVGRTIKGMHKLLEEGEAVLVQPEIAPGFLFDAFMGERLVYVDHLSHGYVLARPLWMIR